jgi:hypothetical protein
VSSQSRVGGSGPSRPDNLAVRPSIFESFDYGVKRLEFNLGVRGGESSMDLAVHLVTVALPGSHSRGQLGAIGKPLASIWPTRRWATSTALPGFRNQFQRQSLQLAELELDFYHLSVNAYKARREIHRDDGEAGRQGAESLLQAQGLRTDLAVVVEMACWVTSRPAGRGASALGLRQRAGGT